MTVWHGQAALVTGGARGIGRAIARLLAQRGAAVCVTTPHMLTRRRRWSLRFWVTVAGRSRRWQMSQKAPRLRPWSPGLKENWDP